MEGKGNFGGEAGYGMAPQYHQEQQMDAHGMAPGRESAFFQVQGGVVHQGGGSGLGPSDMGAEPLYAADNAGGGGMQGMSRGSSWSERMGNLELMSRMDLGMGTFQQSPSATPVGHATPVPEGIDFAGLAKHAAPGPQQPQQQGFMEHLPQQQGFMEHPAHQQGFMEHPGDGMAHHAWQGLPQQRARQEPHMRWMGMDVAAMAQGHPHQLFQPSHMQAFMAQPVGQFDFQGMGILTGGMMGPGFSPQSAAGMMFSEPLLSKHNKYCHFCQHVKVRATGMLACGNDDCTRRFCEHCLSKSIGDDADPETSSSWSSGMWSCPVCRKLCCCSVQECDKNHRHCKAYRYRIRRAEQAQRKPGSTSLTRAESTGSVSSQVDELSGVSWDENESVTGKSEPSKGEAVKVEPGKSETIAGKRGAGDGSKASELWTVVDGPESGGVAPAAQPKSQEEDEEAPKRVKHAPGGDPSLSSDSLITGEPASDMSVGSPMIGDPVAGTTADSLEVGEDAEQARARLRRCQVSGEGRKRMHRSDSHNDIVHQDSPVSIPPVEAEDGSGIMPRPPSDEKLSKACLRQEADANTVRSDPSAVKSA